MRRTRELIRQRGAYGRVSAERFGANHLPFADNLINVVIISDPAVLAEFEQLVDEIQRVLAPLGALYIHDSALTARLEERDRKGGTEAGRASHV